MGFLLNEYEVEDIARRFAGEPVLGPASETLARLVDGVNACSDGWPYWRKPSNASRQLQDLLKRAERGDVEVTPADVRKAYRPIKAFLTRHPNVQCEVVPV